jgi:hypothetical protein
MEREKRERRRQHMDELEEDRKKRESLWKGVRAESGESGGICSSNLTSL